MKIFIDESGRFSLPPSTDRLVASGAMGVVIAESSEDSVACSFNEFKNKVSPDEMSGGEIKGNKLSNQSRKLFIESIILKHAGTGILIAPIVVDDSLVLADCGALRSTSYANRLESISNHDSPDLDLRASIRGIADCVRELSDVQLRRLHAWGLAVRMSIQSALLGFNTPETKDCWQYFHIEIDDVENSKAHGQEVDILKKLLPIWFSTYDDQIPFRVVEKSLSKDSGGINGFVTPDGRFDWRPILRDNIYFENSKFSWGLQIADICSNIAFRAYCNIDENSLEHSFFCEIMRACPYAECGPLFHVSSNLDILNALRSKYSHILPPFH